MKKLLLVTFCDSPAGIGASLWTDTTRTTHTGWTDRRDLGNSILDIPEAYGHLFFMAI